MTESKMPLSSEKTSESDAKVSSNKNTTKASTAHKAETKKLSSNNSSGNSPSKTSKLAVFAVLLAVAAPTGHYYWQQLQNQQLTQTLTDKISKENNISLSRYQKQMQQALIAQKQIFNQQLQQVTTAIQKDSQAKITELDATVIQLEQSIKQRQPSDWLLHEAEYLIRIAVRTLWLEQDTTAAIGLLKDADVRLTELNDPAFLPVREVIHQDIKSLELLPKLQTDEVILALMTMSKQVTQLPLTIESFGEEKDNKTDLELSNDIDDWQSNLTKTWQKFLNDFIRVRQRTGTVEPLMSPEQQAHLKQNLSLKVQLALWAASEGKGDIYQKSLDDIQQWLNEFFDMKNIVNQDIIKTLNDLKKKQVNYSYPNELAALTAIRTTLRNQKIVSPISIEKKTNKIKNEVQDKPIKAVKVAPETQAPQSEQQNMKSKSEGNL